MPEDSGWQAVAIGTALFKFGIKLNLHLFFLVVGILLLLIIGGLVITALGHFDTATRVLSQVDRKSESICFYYEHFARERSCILGPLVWNIQKILPDEKFPGAILSTLFGYRDRLFLVQAVTYLGFLVTTGTFYFCSLRDRPRVPGKS